MRARSFLCITISLFFLSAIPASAWVDIQSLRSSVERYTAETLGDDIAQKIETGSATITAAHLDSRLRLSECDKALTFKLQRPSHGIRNMTVKTSCQGSGKRWTVYVPVTVDIYSDVIVLARSVGRGEILSADDLTTQRMNVAAMSGGHMTDINRAIGMETARTLRPGDTLKPSALREPHVVQKGDAVVLKAGSGGLVVATSGTALNAGSVGTRIRVQNDRSKRVVDALVMGPGMVSVADR